MIQRQINKARIILLFIMQVFIILTQQGRGLEIMYRHSDNGTQDKLLRAFDTIGINGLLCVSDFDLESKIDKIYLLKSRTLNIGVRGIHSFFRLDCLEGVVTIGNISNDKNFSSMYQREINALRSLAAHYLESGNYNDIIEPKVALSIMRDLYRDYMKRFEASIEKSNLLTPEQEESLKLIKSFKKKYM